MEFNWFNLHFNWKF